MRCWRWPPAWRVMVVRAPAEAGRATRLCAPLAFVRNAASVFDLAVLGEFTGGEAQ